MLLAIQRCILNRNLDLTDSVKWPSISLPTYELWWSVYFHLDLATPQVPNSGHQIDLYNYQIYAIEMERAPLS